MKGLKGQGQPCSEPLKFMLKILRILKKWDWAQGMVHQNKNNTLLFFGFVLEKQKRDGKFLDLMDQALSPISLFPNYEKF